MIRMIYKLFSIVCISLAFFIPSAGGITVTCSTDGAGFSVTMNSEIDDWARMTATLGQESLSNTLTGKGDLRDSHWVANREGAVASVGVDIDDSTSYSYSYTLTPGLGVRASQIVGAGESLNVPYAENIKAYAQARNGMGYSVGTGVDITQGSLVGYSNYALASAEGVEASQQFSSAEGDVMQFLSTSGTWYNANTNLPVFIAAKWGDDNPPEAFINTEVGGTIGDTLQSTVTGYQDSVTKSWDLSGDLSDISQSGHVTGVFTSTANAGSKSKDRTSNYGTEYDLLMDAKIEGDDSAVMGQLGYYVDGEQSWEGSPMTIQGGLDHAQSDDTVNVASGTYNEYVDIDKDIILKGTGDPTATSFSLTNGAELGAGSGGITAPTVNINSGSKIQDGILLASQNGEVNVAAGTYIENILIDKPLTLAGVGRDDDPAINTIIQAGETNKPVIKITSSDTTVKNLQVKDATDPFNIIAGIAVGGYGVSNDISHIVLENIASKNNLRGLGIYGFGIDISDINADGIKISSTDVGVLVEALNGGSVSDLSLDNAQITNSRIGVGINEDYSSISGISLDNAKITDSGQFGVLTWANGGSISDICLDNAQINYNYYGVWAEARYGGSVSDLSLDNAQITNSGMYGVYAQVIDESSIGLHMYGGSLKSNLVGLSTYGNVNAVVNHANIYDNTNYNVKNYGTNQIDAQFNYWGGGAPDGIYGDVNTADWVTDPIPVPYIPPT